MGIRSFSLPLALGAGLALLGAWYSGPSSGDDTFIYMRYVRSTLEQGAFAFNPGEKSSGVTSYAWPLLMTPIAAIFGNSLVVWKALGSLLFGLTGVLWFLWARSRGLAPGWCLALTVLAVADPFTLRWNGSGMENSLTLLVVSLAGLAFLHFVEAPSRGGAALFGLLCGLLPFVRPELLLYGAALLAGTFLLVRPRTEPARAALVAGTAVAALSLTAWLLSGSVLPQTAEAKAIALHQTTSGYALLQCLKILAAAGGGAVALLVVLSSRTKSSRVLKTAALGLLAVCTAYLSLKNHLVSTRYVTAMLAPVLVAAVQQLADRLEAGTIGRAVPVLLVVQLLLTTVVAVRQFPVTRTSEVEPARRFAETLRRETPPDARIAAEEVGLLGFYADRYLIDLYGLTDRETLHWLREHGYPRTVPGLEALLLHRRATHYVDCFPDDIRLDGEQLEFVPVAEQAFQRNNMSTGMPVTARWRLYRLVPRNPLVRAR